MDPLDKLPEIDYLSKDYASFRQLILDHQSVLAPDWTEQHPADIGNALVEVLAYVADYLSYYQDAVATEAYLSTARLRRSVQRHVRLLDYGWHEGCNARVWVQVQIKRDCTDSVPLEAGARLFTRLEKGGTSRVISPDSAAYADALAQEPIVFETMRSTMLYAAHNEILFYTPDLGEAWLPEGATSTVLRDDKQKLRLGAGDVLTFEEIRDPKTGLQNGADPTHRHAVRLTQVTRTSPTTVEVEWAIADALPFRLCLAAVYGGVSPVTISVARGNIVLADHGRTIKDELLPAVSGMGRYYPQLRQKGLTYCVPYDQEHALKQPARDTLTQEPRQALPAISLRELGKAPVERLEHTQSLLSLERHGGPGVKPGDYPIKSWQLRSELLSSGVFTRDYAVEMEEDGRAFLRFGFGVVGWQPVVVGAHFVATYRVGNGSAGNIGPDAIGHIVTKDDRIEGARNLMPAQGGTNSKEMEKARLHAPRAFQDQERCVTEADYAAVAARHYDVAQAVAQIHWTGSWHTAVIYVKRHGDRPVDGDPDFRRELLDMMEPFRLACSDLEIREAHYVPVEIDLVIFLQPGYLPGAVSRALKETFGSLGQSDGTDAFFDPENWAFGQTVYRSQVINRAMRVPGVARVDVRRFGRMDNLADVENIPIGPLEIIRLDNDLKDPSKGTFKFTFAGNP
jgi:hypothetical protein